MINAFLQNLTKSSKVAISQFKFWTRKYRFRYRERKLDSTLYFAGTHFVQFSIVKNVEHKPSPI